MSDEERLSRFEGFKEALINGSPELQINISKEMVNLARNLGPEFTKSQLLPFLNEYINVHDEILVIISEQLEHFIPLVGGYDNCQPVLDLLVKLCESEETFVRDRSVETLRNIAYNLSGDQMENLLLPVVETLGSEEDWFTSKCSAAALYPVIYQKVNEEKRADLRNNFRMLIQDDSPIVRKSTAIRLLELLPLLEDDCLRDQFIPVFDNISKDDMDDVRLFAVDIAIELAKRLTENEVEEFLIQTIEGWADDRSWKIRQKLAAHIAEIQDVIPFGKTRGKILLMYQKLVKDSQYEVRRFAAENLVNYSISLKKTYLLQPHLEINFEPVFQQSIIPQIKLLVTDGNDDIRFVLSSLIVSLNTVISEETFKKLILPMIVEILEGDPSTQVRANILMSFDSFPAGIDVTKCFHSISNILKSLIDNSDSHWRTRRSMLVAIMHIAKHSTREYFSDNLKVGFANLLGDRIYALRRTTPLILPLLAKHYGMKWAVENILPYLKMYQKDSRYLYRYIPLFGILEMLYPSVCLGIKQEYLQDLKLLIANSTNEDDKKATVKMLAKILKLVEKINEKFEGQPYKDIFCIQNLEDFRNDNISLYAEDTISVIRNNHDCNIFSIEKNTVLSGNSSYLEGLLCLIYTDLLSLTYRLFEDSVVNVQIRSVYIFNKIKYFINDLNKELADPVLAVALKTLTSEELHQIINIVDLETQPKPKPVQAQEEISTTLGDEDCTSVDLEQPNSSPFPDVVIDTLTPTSEAVTLEEDSGNEESTNDAPVIVDAVVKQS